MRGSKRIKGENFRALRRRLELTQEEMAEKIGVSLHTYHGWEYEKTGGISFKNIRKLRALFPDLEVEE